MLQIDLTSRGLVPQLQQAGCSVTNLEFDGGRQVTRAVALAVATWLLR